MRDKNVENLGEKLSDKNDLKKNRKIWKIEKLRETNVENLGKKLSDKNDPLRSFFFHRGVLSFFVLDSYARQFPEI